MAQTFFYDEQIRRFLLQFIRVLSNFEVQFGKDEDGTRVLQRVPVRYGDVNRQGAQILRGNSENTMANVPMISCYINGLQYDRSRMQEPNFISKIGVRERKYDPDTDSYLNIQGDAFTIERHMPVPYTLQLTADIWTSNTEQKLQLLEQMLVLFNPSLEIQSTDNYVDWTSLSTVNLTGVQWTSRTIPQGVDENIDFATLNFEIPIFISAPAKVKKLGVIERIVTGIWDMQGEFDPSLFQDVGNLIQRKRISPQNYGVVLLNGQAQLLKYEDTISETTTSIGDTTVSKVGTRTDWPSFINLFGEIRAGVSQIRFETDENGTEVVGTIALHPTDESILLVTIDEDTVPANDLGPVAAIIDPDRVGPNAGLTTPSAGTRYLLTNPIGNSNNIDGADAWKGLLPDSSEDDLIADKNDIIQYDGDMWRVTFDASQESGTHYVSNLNTNYQYKWTGTKWVRSYEGQYKEGFWSLAL
jgi:hypothetical protein